MRMEAPAHILFQLHKIDPDVDLMWMGSKEGEGGWLLFSRRPNKAAAASAYRTAQTILESGLTNQNRARYVLHKWMADEGIRPIAIYRGKPDERIVKDLERRTHAIQNRPEEAAQEAMDAASEDEDLTKQKAAVMDAFEANKKDMFRILQGSPQVAVPGGPLKGGDTAEVILSTPTKESN